MKKTMFLLLGLVMVGNTAFGRTVQDTSTVTLTALQVQTISIANIDFGNYVLGETKPSPETGAITITGTPSKSIGLSVPNSLTVTSGSANFTLTMSLKDGTAGTTNNTSDVTLDSSGNGTSILTATIDNVPTIAGDYTGIATVSATYN